VAVSSLRSEWAFSGYPEIEPGLTSTAFFG
jgi:hypothetical protein